MQDSGLLQEVIDKTGYLRVLKEENSLESLARAENVQEMVNVTREFDEQIGGGLAQFLEQKLGRPVQLRTVDTWEGLAKSLANGETVTVTEFTIE